MNFETLWELFAKFLWPIILMYATYLHTRLERMMAKFDSLQEEFYRAQTKIAETYVTNQYLASFEEKISRQLTRIDDKITRILEEKR